MKNIFLTALVILASCSPSDLPEDLIPQQEMAELLVEVHLLESRIKVLNIIPEDSTQAVYDHYQRMLFQEKGISAERYARSFEWYLSNPDKYEKVYQIVVDSLMHRENLMIE